LKFIEPFFFSDPERRQSPTPASKIQNLASKSSQLFKSVTDSIGFSLLASSKKKGEELFR
jgi:hypothetical protein